MNNSHPVNFSGNLSRTSSDLLVALLPSEEKGKRLFPRTISSAQLAVLTMLILFVPVSPSSMTAAGGTALIFWLCGFVGFFLASAIVTDKLGRMFPGEGAFYTWVHRALGPFWDMVLGFFCGWWAPLLLLAATGPALVLLLQSVGRDLDQGWFTDPSQIIVAFLLVLCISWLLGFLPFKVLLAATKSCIYVIGCFLGLMVVVMVWWLVTGQPVQTSFSPADATFAPASLTTFSFVVSSCLGIQIPLNLAGEVREGDSPTGHIRKSVLFIMMAYLISWLALAIILPQNPHDPLSASNFANVGQIFYVALGKSLLGRLLSATLTLVYVLDLMLSTAVLCLVQGRILAMVALDRRLPRSMAKVRQEKPMRAFHAQMAILVVASLVAFGVLPATSDDPDLPDKIASLLLASSLVLWSLSTLGLFLVGIVLVERYHSHAQEVGGVSALGIIFWSAVGTAATIAAAVFACITPGVSSISPGDWAFWLLMLVFVPLAIGSTLATLSPEPEDVRLFENLVERLPVSGQERSGR